MQQHEEQPLLQEAAKVGVQLDGVDIVNPANDPCMERYVDELVEARKKKHLSREAAADLLVDMNYFATMMVRCGDADGLVSGAAHTTAATVRPAMQACRCCCVACRHARCATGSQHPPVLLTTAFSCNGPLATCWSALA